MTEEKEPDVVLSDGREIRFDLYAMKLKDWRIVVDKDAPQELEDEIMARVLGMTVDEYVNLPFLDWRDVNLKALKAFSRPLDDPNSPSGSGST